jgi:hypothetical protein
VGGEDREGRTLTWPSIHKDYTESYPQRTISGINRCSSKEEAREEQPQQQTSSLELFNSPSSFNFIEVEVITKV